ncbi:MAG TPA: hemerythrin domain-containing protein [Vicinamibacterales bacterium]|nr:hemerythrin domain-containing protein [Vicinamibacterales bacterium]
MPTARRSSKAAPKARARKGTAVERASKTARRAARDVVKSVSARVLPARPHDAVKLLEKDHRRFERLMKEGEETTARASKRRRDILGTLAVEIAAHERKEEKVLYPALKRHREARDIVLEGYQEHHVADVLLGELKNLDPTDERWGAKFKVLKESLDHHIEEEEGHMFRTARSVLGRDRLEALGRRMQAIRGTRKKSRR